MATHPEILDIESRAGALGIHIATILKRSGVSPSTWWRWKKGLSDPKLSTLRLVRDALAVTIEACAT